MDVLVLLNRLCCYLCVEQIAAKVAMDGQLFPDKKCIVLISHTAHTHVHSV